MVRGQLYILTEPVGWLGWTQEFSSGCKHPDADVYICLSAGEKESYLWSIKRQAGSFDKTISLDKVAVPVMLG
jgi:hypothetical protein